MPDFMELTMVQRQAVTRKKALACKSADRAGKSWILNELVVVPAQSKPRSHSGGSAAVVSAGRLAGLRSWLNQRIEFRRTNVDGAEPGLLALQ